MRLPVWQPDPLQQRLREQVEALAARAKTGAVPQQDELSQLQAIRELIAVHSIVSGRARRAALWTVAGIALVGAFLLLRVRTLDIDGVVRASSVDFVMDRTRVLALEESVTELSAAGFTRVVGLPVARARSLVATPPTGATLRLEQITIPAGARVRVASVGQGRVLLRVEPAGDQGRARFNSPRGGVVRTGGDTLAMNPGAVVEVEFDAVRFNLRFDPADRTLDLLSGVPARTLSFAEERTVADDTRQDVLTSSTIEGGELVLPALREQRVALRARERLELQTQVLRVHRLRSDTTGLTIEFRMRASRVVVGEEATRRNLKPSRLEWLAANRRLELVRVGFVAALGAVLALARWWRRY